MSRTGSYPTLTAITDVAHLKLSDAAYQLGVCKTRLKNACRHYDIPKWPYNRKKLGKDGKTKELRAFLKIIKEKIRKHETEKTVVIEKTVTTEIKSITMITTTTVITTTDQTQQISHIEDYDGFIEIQSRYFTDPVFSIPEWEHRGSPIKGKYELQKLLEIIKDI